jgi:predicted trehalose synthase
MEKAVYELKYELEHRVENAGIPIAGMIEIPYGSEKPWLRTGT